MRRRVAAYMKGPARLWPGLCLLVAAMWLCVGLLPAEADARPPTAREVATFLPLICEHPREIGKSGMRCTHLVGFPPPSGAAGGIGPPAAAPRFTDVRYGSFTQAGADQAYLTYYAEAIEGHATNFGGGILFERTRGAWKLVRWYRGGQLDQCVPLPATNPMKLICLSGSTNQGESNDSVAVRFVRASGDDLGSGPPLLEAHDTRNTSWGDKNGCYQEVPKGQVYLLGFRFTPTAHGRMQSITPSAPPYFAQVRVVYETAADIAVACGGSHPRKVRETTGTVRFALRSGRVVVTSPATFYREPD